MPDVHARLEELERRVTLIEANIREDMRDLRKDFDTANDRLAKKVDALNGALITAGLSLGVGIIIAVVSAVLAAKWLFG
jgi:hypothetical protein